MKQFCLLFVVATLAFFPIGKLFGQQQNEIAYEMPNTIKSKKAPAFSVQAAGTKYKAGKWKQLWWGKHYRPEWTVPVSFPYLEWSTVKGGLTPIKMGGGHETKTLRVLGGDGKEYVLRTMDKDLSVKVPETLKGTYANDVANDQISTAHPYGPLVIARLAAAAGLLHTNPRFYYVPANEQDTAFNSLFAGKICLLEERPSGKGWQHTPLTNNADKVVNTETLLENIAANNGHKVDQKAFLKVRLFDMLINDWDRHDDQWVWCARSDGNRTVYEPFGRDRDQAFSKTDGINLYFLSRPSAFRSLQNFNSHVKDVIGQNLSAFPLDRQFLNRLSKTEWKIVSEELQDDLTDSLIHEAILSMPDTIVNLSGKELEERLKQRRNNLLDDAIRYYNYLSQQVDVIGSAQKELFTIQTITPDETLITITTIQPNGDTGDTLYRRRFFSSETKWVTLYGLDDDDVFRSTGAIRSHIRIRALGGNGQDQYYSNNAGKGDGRKIAVYESAENPKYYTSIFKDRVGRDSTYLNYDRRAFKPNWYRFTPLLSYNADDGVILGTDYTYRKYGWEKNPFASQQTVGVSYGFASHGWVLSYVGRFSQVLGNWGAEVATTYKSPQYLFNYFGKGNETVLSQHRKSYYRAYGLSFNLEPSLIYSKGRGEYKFGLVYQILRLDSTSDKYIYTQQNKLGARLFSPLHYGGLQGGYTYLKTNNTLYPAKGYGWTANTKWIQQLTTRKEQLFTLSGAFTAYLPLGSFVLVHRSGASTITSNDYPFYQAPLLDGHTNLRGYWRNRFYGKTAFFQNTELRVKLKQANGYVLKGALGLLGFFDDGRVWVPDESSGKWHTGYGGGLFFIPYSYTVLTCTYAVSKEAKTVQLKAGFFF